MGSLETKDRARIVEVTTERPVNIMIFPPPSEIEPTSQGVLEKMRIAKIIDDEKLADLDLRVKIDGKECRITLLAWQGYEEGSKVGQHTEKEGWYEIYWPAAGVVKATRDSESVKIESGLSDEDLHQSHWIQLTQGKDDDSPILSIKLLDNQMMEFEPSIQIPPQTNHSTDAVSQDRTSWILAMKAEVVSS